MAASAMKFSDLPKTIKRPLTVGEVAAIAEVDRKAVNRMIDDGVLPRYFLYKKGTSRRRLLKPTACPAVHFNATTGRFLSPRMRLRAFDRIDRIIRNSTTQPVLEEGILRLDFSKVLSATLGRMLALAKAEADVEIDDETRGGAPVLRGTRIMVYELASLAEVEPIENILAAFPGLTPERVENAKMFAKAHPMNGRPRKTTGLPAGARKVCSTKVGPGTL